MPNLLLLSDKAERYAALLDTHNLEDLTVLDVASGRPRRDAIAGAEIILGDPDRVAGILPQARRLVWVQSTFAGIDALCRPDCARIIF